MVDQGVLNVKREFLHEALVLLVTVHYQEIGILFLQVERIVAVYLQQTFFHHILPRYECLLCLIDTLL